MNKKSKLAAAPYLLWMIVFIVVPLLLIAVFAFTTTATCDADGNVLSEEELAEYLAECEENEVEPELTEKNVFTFQNILDVSKYSTVLVNSAWLALIATAICLVIAYPLAYMISRMFYSRQKLALMLVMLPMWMNFLLRTYAWMTLLEKNGLINKFFGLFGIGPFNMINTQGAVVLGMIYNYLPFMILPLYTTLSKLDKSLIEAAEDLGANGFTVFMRVILPLSVPGIISGVTMVLLPSMTNYVVLDMLYNSTYIMGSLIGSYFAAYDWNNGSMISLILLIIIFIITLATNRFSDSGESGGRTVL